MAVLLSRWTCSHSPRCQRQRTRREDRRPSSSTSYGTTSQPPGPRALAWFRTALADLDKPVVSLVFRRTARFSRRQAWEQGRGCPLEPGAGRLDRPLAWWRATAPHRGAPCGPGSDSPHDVWTSAADSRRRRAENSPRASASPIRSAVKQPRGDVMTSKSVTFLTIVAVSVFALPAASSQAALRD